MTMPAAKKTSSLARTSSSKMKRKPLRRLLRGIRYELRLNDRESEMLQAVMDAEGTSAAELVRRWLKSAYAEVRKM